MSVRDGFIETIGNTPLIRLEAASEATGCEILGKAEFMNPGGSIKDRAAWWMIREAERDGSLQPGLWEDLGVSFEAPLSCGRWSI